MNMRSARKAIQASSKKYVSNRPPNRLLDSLPRKAARDPSAFTLVELMAVIGVIALLAVVGIPAIKGLTGSGGRKQALAQVLGALEVARNTAIVTGTNTAVIFPSTNSGLGDAYNRRSMAVVAWNPTNTDTNSMVGPWIVLPQGIYFKKDKFDALPIATNINVMILTKLYKGSFPAIVFQSNGALCQDYTPLPTNGIAFHEGLTPPTNQTSFETVRLYPYTGRAIPTYAP